MARGFTIVVLNTLLLLAVAEAAARLAERLHPGGDQVVFAYSPYRMLKMVQAPWPLDRQGFRAADLETYRNRDRGGFFLIEFLGGSVCVGVGDHPGRTVPERVEAALHARGLARARVLNLCQGGATSAQELAILTEYGLPLHPQAVLSFDGANDVLHPRPVGQDDAANLPYENSQLEARVDGRDALTHLALARVALRLAIRFHLAAPAGDGAPVDMPSILDSYLYHLELARTLTRAGQGFYAVLLQPTLHLDKPWSQDETALWRRARPSDAGPLTHLIEARYAQARDRLGQWGSANGVPVYDLTRVFAQVPDTVYSDSVHFHGGRGYEILAAELELQGLTGELSRAYRKWESLQ